jgi:L-threonylcarbamoyladenylate synthase
LLKSHKYKILEREVSMEILKPSPQNIVKMAKAIEKGALALLPSDVAYGLVTNPFIEESIKKIREVRKAPPNDPVQVFLQPEEIDKYAQVSPFIIKVLKGLFPAAIVVVLLKKSNVPDYLAPGLSTLGVSWHEEPTLAAVCRAINIPLAVRPAAMVGGVLHRDFETAKEFGEGKADIAMDCGSTKYRTGSGTLVDMTSPDIKILNEGVVPAAKVNEIIRRIKENEDRS